MTNGSCRCCEIAVRRTAVGRDRLTSCRSSVRRGVCRVEQPVGRPVRAGHVAGEKRRLQPQTRSRRRCRRRSAGRASAVVLTVVRRRLEALPEQEEPDVREAEVADHRELLAHLPGVEVRPPVHRLASRPVVDAEQEGIAGRAARPHAAQRNAEPAPRRGPFAPAIPPKPPSPSRLRPSTAPLLATGCLPGCTPPPLASPPAKPLQSS